MDDFEPMRDYFYRRAAKTLNQRATAVRLANITPECQRDSFVFPGSDFAANIEVNGVAVGEVDYGINPLGDRLYINEIEVEPEHRRRGIALSVLWLLFQHHQLPIVPLHQRGDSFAFWSMARERLNAVGALIEDQIRTCELDAAKQRWQHLVPEPDHLRQIRELKASPEWPAIEARIKASEQS
ncbi:GNAT family N-acetyltransferase [Pseudomonas sp. IB20]|uniref:GNAT family N-acetyltransferase n=1 Tax=Pseudomonas TaxID=286 RepID=UPI000BA0B705|nr:MULTISPECIES: GNAT family N-acetyltransferase [unclassified Pseudomonas]MCV2226910.1 GNAT family N-acetyltransferase [Pseudomonas sp. AU10]OZO01365.1 GNAT family N-acetyltransferase [Pseudomonas sp. IB20]WKV17785.1 N-acetyltransferase [Pseudomonas sp. AU10]